EARLHRNFQGYTTDAAPALIGFGASAIGRLPQGYVQNITATGQYMKAIDAGGLAIAKGVAFSDDDRLRGAIIERLMCDFRVEFEALRRLHGSSAEAVVEEMAAAARRDTDGLVACDGTT